MGPVYEALEFAREALRKREFGKAELLLKQFNSESSRRNIESLLLLAQALEGQGRLKESSAVVESAARLARTLTERARILNKAAGLLLTLKDLAENDQRRIVRILEESVNLWPGVENSIARRHLCSIYCHLRRYGDLKEHSECLLGVPEHSLQAKLWIAFACFYLDQKAVGVQHLEDTVNVSATLSAADAHTLLDLLVCYSCFNSAQSVIDKAPDAHRETFWMLEFQADVHIGTERYAEALSILNPEKIEACNDEQRRRRLYAIRARCLEKKQRYAEAYDAFAIMNSLARLAAPGPPSDIAGRYARMSLASLRVTPAHEPGPYVPVFMIGFPRSGTTLLDTILDTQPGIHTFSEIDGVTFARLAMRELGKNYPEELNRLNGAEIRNLREAYFNRNAQFLSRADIADVMIDKLPLNIIHVPFIRALFPGARFILSLRHPVDVCLSCFQQDFIVNGEMIYFTDIEECFVRYRDVMSLFGRYSAELDLEVHTVKYEELTSDIDTVARGVFAFLGVEPNQDFLKFDLFNTERMLVTPSRAQVTKPVYKTSCNRWRHYEVQLVRYLPIVQPFLEQYGYTA